MQSVPITTNVKSLNPALLKRGLLDTTLCDEVCQWLANSQWFSPGTTVSFTNKTDRRHITEILLKVALSTITPSNYNDLYFMLHWLWLEWSCILHVLYLGYIKLLFRLSSMYTSQNVWAWREDIFKNIYIFDRTRKSTCNCKKKSEEF